MLTRNASSLLLCGVGDAFLDQNIRYHCPIYAIFNFDKHKQICYKRNIWQYDIGNYDRLKQYVNEFDWLSLKSDNVNIYAYCIFTPLIISHIFIKPYSISKLDYTVKIVVLLTLGRLVQTARTLIRSQNDDMTLLIIELYF